MRRTADRQHTSTTSSHCQSNSMSDCTVGTVDQNMCGAPSLFTHTDTMCFLVYSGPMCSRTRYVFGFDYCTTES